MTFCPNSPAACCLIPRRNTHEHRAFTCHPRTWLRVHDGADRTLYADAASVDAVRCEADGSLTVWQRRNTVGYTVAEAVTAALAKLQIAEVAP